MIKIGKRNLRDFLLRIFDVHSYRSILNFIKIYPNPFSAMWNEIFSLGTYPRTIKINKRFKIKLYSIHDYSTFNLIFCRKDYFIPKNFDLVIDIGSNIGISVLYWLFNAPNSTVICYEPSSLNYTRLKKNLSLFKKNTIIKKKAVANFSGKRKIFLSKYGVINSIKEKVSNNYEICDVININKCIKEALKRKKYIDIIKIDVEGFETEILKSIKKEYFNRIAVINIEGYYDKKIIPKYFSFSRLGSATRFVNNNILS